MFITFFYLSLAYPILISIMITININALAMIIITLLGE